MNGNGNLVLGKITYLKIDMIHLQGNTFLQAGTTVKSPIHMLQTNLCFKQTCACDRVILSGIQTSFPAEETTQNFYVCPFLGWAWNSDLGGPSIYLAFIPLMHLASWVHDHRCGLAMARTARHYASACKVAFLLCWYFKLEDFHPSERIR